MKVFLKKFLALIDTPTAFVGQALKLVQVNLAADALEFTNEIVGPVLLRFITEAEMNLVTLLVGEFAIASDTGQTRYGDGVTQGGIPSNMASSTTILCPAIGTPVENAARLRARILEGASLTPNGSAMSTDNRGLVLMGSGVYDFELGDVADDNHGLELPTEFLDLRSVTGNPADVILTSAIATASRGTVEQTADDVRLSGFTMAITSTSSTGVTDTLPSAYFPSTAIANTRLTDIVCSSVALTSITLSMRRNIEYAGVYTRVVSGEGAFGWAGTLSGVCNYCVCGENSYARGGTLSGTLNACKGDYRSLFATTITATAQIYDFLLETGVSTGVYAYLPENVKRLNGSDSPSDTGIDMTSTATITWANASGYALQVSSDLVLSNLDTGAETFSVAITSASGANTFTSTKASGATWTIPIPQFLGSVADAANYVIEISTDNVANTSVNYTLNVVEQAVL